MIADSNARLAAARRLTRRQARREAGRFLAEWAQAVREALRHPKGVVQVYATAEAVERNVALIDEAKAAGVRVDEISTRAAAALSETVTPQGLVAVCRKIDIPLRKMFASQPRLVAVLVDANDPGNAGAILRTADAAGAQAVVLAGESVDVYNGKAVRASAGSLFHVDVVVDADVADLIDRARKAGCIVRAATGSGDHDIERLGSGDERELARPTVWLFGNEAHGLPATAIEAADQAVQVPIYGSAESLNVAAAAAICLYASARAQHLVPAG